jgi:hypothetical protein
MPSTGDKAISPEWGSVCESDDQAMGVRCVKLVASLQSNPEAHIQARLIIGELAPDMRDTFSYHDTSVQL